jgi:protein-S-isoprenylcysteine O-methyltransferase Ste14
MKNIFKTVFVNLGIILIALLAIFFLLKLDTVLGLPNFYSFPWTTIGSIVLFIGIIIRLWASFTFYQNGIKVIAVKPQSKFIRKGPYRFSRNPLYIGIICIDLGVSLIVGSPSGVVLAILFFVFWSFYTRLIDEPRLKKSFGEEYLQYEKEVPRWFGF